jgi:hypothetical protein
MDLIKNTILTLIANLFKSISFVDRGNFVKSTKASNTNGEINPI